MEFVNCTGRFRKNGKIRTVETDLMNQNTDSFEKQKLKIVNYQTMNQELSNVMFKENHQNFIF